jgi:predicted DNA-binding protein with PD1-like motif
LISDGCLFYFFFTPKSAAGSAFARAMKKPSSHMTYENGKTLLVRLPDGGDLLTSIEETCARHSIQTATFTVWGATRNCTWGIYDPGQRVYITSHREEACQIAHCTGNVSIEKGNLTATAACVLVDASGQIAAGQLFSETAAIGAEMVLRELQGEPLHRCYDEASGLYLWPKKET